MLSQNNNDNNNNEWQIYNVYLQSTDCIGDFFYIYNQPVDV